MEIKKKEVMVSIAIVAILLMIGFIVSNNLTQKRLEEYQVYDSAMQVEEDKGVFEYCMRTNIGNAFVYGELKALDPVSYPDVEGKYSYIKKMEQEYTRHYRLVTRKYLDSQGKTRTRKKVEYYWTWDTVNVEEKTATKISFLGVEFEYGKIPFPPSHKIGVVNTGDNKRNVYYGTEAGVLGTMFASLKDETIEEAKFYERLTINEVKESLEKDNELLSFWVVWIIFIIIIVFIFYDIKNEWLD